MPLLDRQKAGVVLGHIRIGTKVATRNGKMRPEKLTTFRLTSPLRDRVEAAAALYGGTVAPWQPNDGAAQQWEVVTTTDRLPVRVPPGEPVRQMYELWGANRQRLCDGVSERMKGTPCVCPSDLLARKQLAQDGRACKPTTRLTLILADLPGLGVWMLSSTGDAAADELASVAELLRLAETRGVMLSATLRLEQREGRGSGELHRYAVPVLDVEHTLTALEAGDLRTPTQIEAARQAQIGPAGAQAPARPQERPVLAVDGPTVPQEPATPSGAPVGSPPSPQALFSLACETEDPAVVRQLRALAVARGWVESEFVTDCDGVDVPLDNALYARLEATGGLG